jgi:hypothetical protein
MINGVQIIASRVIDARRTLVIGAGILSFLLVAVFPRTFAGAPAWLQPIVGSPLVLATIIALALILIFRIGIKRSRCSWSNGRLTRSRRWCKTASACCVCTFGSELRRGRAAAPFVEAGGEIAESRAVWLRGNLWRGRLASHRLFRADRIASLSTPDVSHQGPLPRPGASRWRMS